MYPLQGANNGESLYMPGGLVYREANVDSVSKINLEIDAVVMLTTSDWFTELRSNRYHYATRFAKIYPVIFVQPDLTHNRYYFENTLVDNVVVLHVTDDFSSTSQLKNIAEALNSKGIITPLLWIYNPRFIQVIQNVYSPYRIYHATEDYFAKDYLNSLLEDNFIDALQLTLNDVDLIVCVSEGVNNGVIQANCKLKHKTITISNGCDYQFYKKDQTEIAASVHANNVSKKIAFYQGNIFSKLDFKLLLEVATQLPDWTFRFCGPVVSKNNLWKRLTRMPNVHYLGKLTAEQLRTQAHAAGVGIIPFQQNFNLVKRTFPLKAFEYLACGLPVVSTPIDALQQFDDLFLFADDAQSFIKQLLQAETRAHSTEFFQRSQKIASEQSYDNKFISLIDYINSNVDKKITTTDKLRILVLYEGKSLNVTAITDHLQSFIKHSNHTIEYYNATENFQPVDLDSYDAVVIHYSIRISVPNGGWTISQSIKCSLQSYPGLKVVFIQDEYDTTNTAIKWINDLGVQLVFTCVPEKYIRTVYPRTKLPHVRFINNLTGYVNDYLMHYPVKPLSERTTHIAYRGRNLPYWYGRLGQEKEIIGRVLKEVCQQKGLIEDIEWHESKRIYGDSWYPFLSSAKATLGTESGANVFDFDGQLIAQITEYLIDKPDAGFEEVYERFLQEHEALIHMNQISPKIFEAICLHTALILFEGSYSGVLTPHRHYIVLKKDFSNIEEVLNKLHDEQLLMEMVALTFKEIILEGSHSYGQFIAYFDSIISECVPKKLGNKNKVTLLAPPQKQHVDLKKVINVRFIKLLARRIFFGKLLSPVKILLRNKNKSLDKIFYKLRCYLNA
jgi:glycosyltransferase involved in cell wall biosynthesis/regulator of sigma D